MLYCIAIEQGPWVAGLALIAFVVMLACVGLVGWLLYRLFASVLRNKTKVKIVIEGKEIQTVGPISGIFVVALLFVLIGAPIYGLVWLYQRADGYYAAAVDAGASPTISQLRKQLVENDQRTRLKIVVFGAANDVRVSGTFRGTCLADLFDVICNAHSDKLSCSSSIWSQTYRIESK